MRILFDHGTPSGTTRRLVGHVVTEARDRGWDRSGDLLDAAESAGFDILLTTDKNMRHRGESDGPPDFHCDAWQLAMAGCAVHLNKIALR
jgi:hypothetical protein